MNSIKKFFGFIIVIACFLVAFVGIFWLVDYYQTYSNKNPKESKIQSPGEYYNELYVNRNYRPVYINGEKRYASPEWQEDFKKDDSTGRSYGGIDLEKYSSTHLAYKDAFDVSTKEANLRTINDGKAFDELIIYTANIGYGDNFDEFKNTSDDVSQEKFISYKNKLYYNFGKNDWRINTFVKEEKFVLNLKTFSYKWEEIDVELAVRKRSYQFDEELNAFSYYATYAGDDYRFTTFAFKETSFLFLENAEFYNKYIDVTLFEGLLNKLIPENSINIVITENPVYPTDNGNKSQTDVADYINLSKQKDSIIAFYGTNYAISSPRDSSGEVFYQGYEDERYIISTNGKDWNASLNYEAITDTEFIY